MIERPSDGVRTAGAKNARVLPLPPPANAARLLPRWKLWALLVVAVASPDASATQSQGNHPRLVSVEAARCESCHGELLQGQGSQHGPAEAGMCESCHEFHIDPSGTSVSLTEAEPGLCLACHSDLAPAASAENGTRHAPLEDSCLTCHDPHSAAEERLLNVAVPEICLSCHDLEDLSDSHSGQLSERVDCRSCHNPHASEGPHLLSGMHLHAPFEDRSCEACHRAPFAGRIRLTARNEKLCTACHGDFADDAGKSGSVHPPIHANRDGRGCLSCHYPHVGPNAKLLVKAGPTLCQDCHEAVVAGASAETGHPPAGEDCLSCHAPHASEQRSLLAAPAAELCAMCHDVEDAELVQAHLAADLATLECTTCHTPHGSGNEHLLAEHVHPPVLDGCDVCHEGSASELMEDGESALCLACHDDIGELAASASVPHGALDLARCADCHDPHASKQLHLVKTPGAGPCLDCHDEQAPAAGEFGHGAIDLLGCGACHEPHGGENESLLRKTGNELCLDCHDARTRKVKDGVVTLGERFTMSEPEAGKIRGVLLDSESARGHPTPNHPVAGRSDVHSGAEVSFDGELTCLSCHDPHKGKSERLFRWDAKDTFEACLHCHPK